MMMKCEACGVPWSDHLGPTALCDNLHRRAAEIKKLRAEIDRLEAELENSAREESEALTQVEKFSIENGRLVDENKRLIGADAYQRDTIAKLNAHIRQLEAEMSEPAEVRATAMECSLRIVEGELDQTRAKLADALRLSPEEFQRLRKPSSGGCYGSESKRN